MPNIPTAAEIDKNGLKLGEMNAKLLQKIEELTLYLIDKDEQLKIQNKRLGDLEQQVKSLQNK